MCYVVIYTVRKKPGPPGIQCYLIHQHSECKTLLIISNLGHQPIIAALSFSRLVKRLASVPTISPVGAECREFHGAVIQGSPLSHSINYRVQKLKENYNDINSDVSLRHQKQSQFELEYNSSLTKEYIYIHYKRTLRVMSCMYGQ